MLNVNIDEDNSFRPRRPRGHGGKLWLIRGIFISAHLAMAYVALSWISAGETPPSGVKATAPHPSAPPKPVAPAWKPTIPSSSTNAARTFNPPKSFGTGRPSPTSYRVGESGTTSGSGDANRTKPDGNAEPGRPNSSKSLRESREDAEPAPTRLSEQEAIEVLEAKGIKRGGLGTILTAESVATSRLLALRSRAVELNQAMMRLAMINQVLAELREIDQAVINLNNEITQIGTSMAQYPAVWSRGQWFHGYNNIQNGEYEAFKAQKLQDERSRGEFNRRRDSLRLDQPGRQQGEAIQDLKRRRETAVAALTELQSAIASTRTGYANLRTDPETTRALADLRLGRPEPSPEFLQVERECKEFEKSADQLKLSTRP